MTTSTPTTSSTTRGVPSEYVPRDNSVHYCAKYRWGRVYYISCTTGCCGDLYTRHCCVGTPILAGILTSTIIGLLLMAVVTCMCLKKYNYNNTTRVVSPASRPALLNVPLSSTGRIDQNEQVFYGEMKYQSDYFPQPPPYKPRESPPPYLSRNLMYEPGTGVGGVVPTPLCPGVHSHPLAQPADVIPSAYTPLVPHVPEPSSTATLQPIATTVHRHLSMPARRLYPQQQDLATFISERRLTGAGSQCSHIVMPVRATAESQPGTMETQVQQIRLTSQSRNSDTETPQTELENQANKSKNSSYSGSNSGAASERAHVVISFTSSVPGTVIE